MSYNQPTVSVFRLDARAWALLAIGIAAVCMPFVAALHNVGRAWFHSDVFSYGVVIPFISAFLVWQQSDRLERIRFEGSWVGVAVLVAGAGIALAGKVGSLYAVSQYGILIAFGGLLLAATGWRAFRLLVVPVLILFLAVPLPAFLMNSLSLELQLLSSQIGVALIRAFGISVYLEGNVIDLGVYKLQVAEACDGLRYLFPLMTLAFIMAYFFRAPLWKRVVVFVASVPLTILMNSLRVGLIGIMVEYGGVGMAEGFVHDFQGWLMFMLCTALLLGLMVMLAGIGPDRRPWREVFGLEFPAATPAGAVIQRRTVPLQLWIGAMFAVLMAGLAMVLPERATVVPERRTFAEFPSRFDGWTGRASPMESVHIDALKLDDYILADYVRLPGGVVNLYVAWYDSQAAGESAHSPRSCLPGGGWKIADLNVIDVPGVEAAGRPLRVNRALIEYGDDRQLVYYWFQQRGRVITNEYLAKWYLFHDGMTKQRTDGALIRLVAPVRNGDEANADRILTDFAAAAVPRLAAHVPD